MSEILVAAWVSISIGWTIYGVRNARLDGCFVKPWEILGMFVVTLLLVPTVFIATVAYAVLSVWKSARKIITTDHHSGE